MAHTPVAEYVGKSTTRNGTTTRGRRFQLSSRSPSARIASAETRHSPLSQSPWQLLRFARSTCVEFANSDRLNIARRMALERPLCPLVRLRAVDDGLWQMPRLEHLPRYSTRCDSIQLASKAVHLHKQPPVRVDAVPVVNAEGRPIHAGSRHSG